ncbi:hypothetical protein BFJ63_vAg13883 [Fusarium oxysporum f. sp. narcissi]|uniref:ER transporter 6TM N-terminal domain-containing protein n=1 Tax=Fusarium oxysporum f. sp. narcissi TaxID=451672 RepID=A0A4V1RYY3_FUSOX|nr:hypothetical protein FOWG_09932 [Fusarium oxysporum f. sp. lycopersici MN25]RKL19432.1 hypothetical protein BFJ70_g13919 [Fusarium oxysporum]RYC83206.1 hypothetical protein BFJ63_vAg13883 [Fusarium oxysporum f. sp. narcissi]
MPVSVGQRLKSGWKSLSIDRKILMLMFKGSIPVAISLSFYQSTPVSKTFTSLGFLVAIIAVVTVNVLPRAKLLELTFGICSLTAIAIPLAMLATWSGLQARFHTDPNGLHAYNSSQSAITAIWLTFHIWVSNSIQARFPALLIPTILYNIFMIVQFTSCSVFTTWKECWDLIYLTVRCYYTGIAISFFSGLFFYPTTCRTEIFEVQEKYFHCTQRALSESINYLTQLSTTPTFPLISGQSSGQSARQSDSNDGADAQGRRDQAEKSLKKQVSSVKELYTKMHEELVMAKREIAWGKLRTQDLDAISDLCRRILMPVGGMSHLPDILKRVEENGGWVPFDTQVEQKQVSESNDPTDKAKSFQEYDRIWQNAVGCLVEPASDLVKAVNDGLEHAGLQMELIPRPGAKGFIRRMLGTRGNKLADTESKGGGNEPGSPEFSKVLEEKLDNFSKDRVASLNAWVDNGHLPADLKTDPHRSNEGGADERLSPEILHRDRQQLYLLLYIQQMLYSAGISVLELCKFTDEIVAKGVMTRNRLIVPSFRRVYKWLLSIFDTTDQALADDDRPGSKKEVTLVFGQSTRQTRDIEHLPPTNAYERFGVKIQRFQGFLKGPEFSFGFRSACATMSCAIIAFLEPTQTLFIHYRLIWSVIIAAIGANMSAGQSGVSYSLRILGSFAALIICYLVWYIPDGHTAGVIVLMWFAAFLQMYFLIRWPRYIIGWLVVFITEVLSIGYETQVNKIGVEAATSSGVIYYKPYSVVAVRVACVLWGTCASMFFTYLPYPITARGILRRNMAAIMHLVGNYHTVVHTTLKARLRGTEGDVADKKSQGHLLSRTRRAMFNKTMVLNSSVKHNVYLQKYEPTLGGKFPVVIFSDIISQLGMLLDYIALLSYSTQAWSLHGPHSQYYHTSTRTREWMEDLASLLTSTNVLEERITVVLYQLSGAVATGQPLPRRIEPGKLYQLSKRLSQLDPAILDIRHIQDLGYSTYAVVEMISNMINHRVNVLTQSIENLVGITYFDVDKMYSIEHGEVEE